MMRSQIKLTLSVAALLVAQAGIARATVLTFGAVSGVPGSNTDLAVPYGSNKAVADAEFTNGGEGMTPNIALVWAPTGGTVPNAPDIDVLEYHSAGTFTNGAGPAFVAPVLQLDIDASNHTVLPADPSVDFIPSGGVAVRIHELKIGNATDQAETAYSLTLSILELPSLTSVSSYTTAAMVAGNSEIATFNYTGLPGVSYRLLIHDNSDPLAVPAINPHPRTAIDDVRFSQVVPEPTTLALVALCGLGLAARRGRRS